MIYVKLIRRQKGKITCEVLNLKEYACYGAEYDEIVIAPYEYEMSGLRLTARDFENLYTGKGREAEKQKQERQTAEEKERQKELEELKFWKSEMQNKNFIQQIFALLKMNKRKKEEWKE